MKIVIIFLIIIWSTDSYAFHYKIYETKDTVFSKYMGHFWRGKNQKNSIYIDKFSQFEVTKKLKRSKFFESNTVYRGEIHYSGDTINFKIKECFKSCSEILNQNIPCVKLDCKYIIKKLKLIHVSGLKLLETKKFNKEQWSFFRSSDSQTHCYIHDELLVYKVGVNIKAIKFRQNRKALVIW